HRKSLWGQPCPTRCFDFDAHRSCHSQWTTPARRTLHRGAHRSPAWRKVGAAAIAPRNGLEVAARFEIGTPAALEVAVLLIKLCSAVPAGELDLLYRIEGRRPISQNSAR